VAIFYNRCLFFRILLWSCVVACGLKSVFKSIFIGLLAVGAHSVAIADKDVYQFNATNHQAIKHTIADMDTDN